MTYMFIFAFLGTIGFSILGVLFSIFKTKFPEKLVRFLQVFTAGSIFVLLITHVIKESIMEYQSITQDYFVIAGIATIALVVGAFYLIHYIFDKMHPHSHGSHCESHDIHIHHDKPLFITALLFLVSISLHNIPEGLAIGSSFLENPLQGCITSIFVFGFHNFVIGYAVCESFLNSNTSKLKSALLTISSAVLAYSFAIVGYFVGAIDIQYKAIMLCISAGAMLFIMMKELLPTAIKKIDNTFALSIALGIIITTILIVSF